MTDLQQLAEKVVTNAKSSPTQQLAQKYGLNVQTRVWEDMSRTKGSVWGPAISDMTLQVKDVDMPIIRYPNFSDRTWDISLDEIKVVVGNQRRGENIRFITLREYLRNFGDYLTDREPGLSLLAPRDSEAIVSAQATMLPVSKGQNTPFNVAIFNYQTRKDDPAVLAIVISANGSSAQVINQDSQKLYFNDAGQRTSFVATRLSDYRAEQGKSTSGPMTEKEQVLNGLLVIQVPLKQTRPSGSPVPFANLKQMSLSTISTKSFMESSDVENVVIRPGQPEGPFDELKDFNIVRDERYPIRVTLQYYKGTSNGVINNNDMREIADQIRASQNNAVAIGSLVTGGFTGRSTETYPDRNRRSDKPKWWNLFWSDYGSQVPMSEQAALDIILADLAKGRSARLYGYNTSSITAMTIALDMLQNQARNLPTPYDNSPYIKNNPNSWTDIKSVPTISLFDIVKQNQGKN